MRAKMAEQGGHVQQPHYPESWVSVQKRESEGNLIEAVRLPYRTQKVRQGHCRIL